MFIALAFMIADDAEFFYKMFCLAALILASDCCLPKILDIDDSLLCMLLAIDGTLYSLPEIAILELL